MRNVSLHILERETSKVSQADRNMDLAINGLLINPFRNKDESDMAALIEGFMDITDIDPMYTDHIRKGAYLAQDEGAFSRPRDDGLTLKKEEIYSLQMEDPAAGNKWDQPFLLYALVTCTALAAAVQGWDETAVNQAQVFYQGTLGIPGSASQPSVLLGLVNSAPYLSCALVGCWLTDPLNRLFGRRGTIFLSCFIVSVTCLAQAFVSTWWAMFIARFALGFGMGPKSATVPVYAAECSPKQIRGALVMMWQMWTAFGIMLGYIAGVVFQDVVGDLKWRLVIGSPSILPIVVMLYVFILPESPRWLIEKGRKSKHSGSKYHRRAFEALCRLRRTRLQAARDLFLIYHMLEEEEKIKQQRNRFVEMFTVARNRRALRAGVLVMFMQQFCGVNVLAYFSSLIFQIAGYDSNRALQASMGFGIINFVFALPAVKTIDTFGRRNLLLLTFPFMAIFQLFTGLAFLASDVNVKKGLVTTGMYLFSVAYSPGEGPVPFLYSSECMPLYVRDLSMSLFTAVTWFFNAILAITFPPFINAFGVPGTFAYYAAWCLVGFVLILLFVPETGNQSLEELDFRFSIPTRTFMRHGMRQAKYFCLHTLLRRSMTKPKLHVPVSIPARESRAQGTSTGLRKIPVDHDIERLRSVA